MESQTTQTLKEEIDLNFFIQLAEVRGKYTEYFKLYVKIRDAKTENEIVYQHLSPEETEFRKILEQIEKLYKVYKDSNNEKLIEGAREEILKLVSLIIWNVYH